MSQSKFRVLSPHFTSGAFETGREASVIAVQPQVKFVAFVGIDWADQRHVLCLQAAGSIQRESGELEHKPETVEAWVGELCRQAEAQKLIASVTEASEKKKWVHFRRACAKFLRQSFHEWAGHSIAQSVWARAYYQQ